MLGGQLDVRLFILNGDFPYLTALNVRILLDRIGDLAWRDIVVAADVDRNQRIACLLYTSRCV